jgi:uncharacterized protein YqiB (DUF1249 family)
MTYDDDFWRHIWADLEPGDLPGDLETLARGMGMDGTRRLTEYQRGQLYVPTAKQAQQESFFGEEGQTLPPALEGIAEHVGEDVALYLAQHWSGALLYIPKPESVVRAYRDDHLLDEFRGGATVQELAERYDLTTERVMQILRAEGEQTEMWE